MKKEDLAHTPKDLLSLTKLGNSEIEKAEEFACPACKVVFDDNEKYKVGGKAYPIVINDRQGSTMDGPYHDWEEVHCCPQCEKLFYFTNGAY